MRFKISTKIGIVFFIFLVEILAFMLIFSMVNRRHEQNIHELREEIIELDLLRKLQLALAQVVMPVNDFLIAGGGADELENFKVLSTKTEGLIEKLDKLEFDRAEEREVFNRMKEEYLRLKDTALKIFSLSSVIENPEARRLMEKMDKMANNAIIEANKFFQLAYEEIEEAEQDMRRAKDLFDLVILVVILFNTSLILVSLFFFRHTISSPLNSIRDVVLEADRGNLERKVNLSSNDEIGDLAGAFNKMIADLKRLMQKEKELAAATAAAEAEHKRAAELERAYKKLEEMRDMLIQAEKLNAVGQLASGVAHEVKNPLGIIIQGVNYLEKKISPQKGEAFETLGMIKDSVKRANDIIQSLLDFSRVTNLVLQPEDINSILEDSLTLVKQRLKFERIEIIRRMKQGLPKVLVDKNRMEQVFINIFLNAIQAIPEKGKIIIRSYDTELKEIKNGIGRRAEDHFKVGEKAVVVEIEDTGMGISEENIKKIFDPFFTTKGPRQGAGLGLSVTRNIISMHRGLIEVKSQIGKGTKVVIILKIATS